MADLPTSSIQPTPSGSKELSMEVRLLIAFLLMGLVLFVTPYLYKPAPVPKSPPAPAPKTAPAATAVPETKATEAAAKAPPAAATPGQIHATSEEELAVDTDLYRIRFTNHGAAVKSWLLKKFKDAEGKPLELVNQAALAKVPGPFAVAMKDDQTASLLNFAYFVGKRSEDGLGVSFEFSDGKTQCSKTFRFAKDKYLWQFNDEVTQNGAPAAHLISWRGGFGDPTVLNRQAAQKVVYYDIPDSKLNTKDAKAA